MGFLLLILRLNERCEFIHCQKQLDETISGASQNNRDISLTTKGNDFYPVDSRSRNRIRSAIIELANTQRKDQQQDQAWKTPWAPVKAITSEPPAQIKSRLEMPKFPVPKHIPRWICCELDPNVVHHWVSQSRVYRVFCALSVMVYWTYSRPVPALSARHSTHEIPYEYCWSFPGLCSSLPHSWRQLLQVKGQHSLIPFFGRADPSVAYSVLTLLSMRAFAHERTTKLRSPWPWVSSLLQLSSIPPGAGSRQCPWEPQLLGSAYRWLSSTFCLRSLSWPVHPWSGNNATGREGCTHTNYLCISFQVKIQD